MHSDANTPADCYKEKTCCKGFGVVKPPDEHKKDVHHDVNGEVDEKNYLFLCLFLCFSS